MKPPREEAPRPVGDPAGDRARQRALHAFLDETDEHDYRCSCQACADRHAREKAGFPPLLVSHDRIQHAAHYMYGTGGHDLERWVVKSTRRPTREQLDAIGVANDAEYHSGHLDDRTYEQHWTYVARRPLSDTACMTCILRSEVRR